jgi:hypothetical protein
MKLEFSYRVTTVNRYKPVDNGTREIVGMSDQKTFI